MKRLVPWCVCVAAALAAWPEATLAAPGGDAADLPLVEARLDTYKVALGDRIGLSLELRYRTDQRLRRPDIDTWLRGLAPRPATIEGPTEQDGCLLLRYRTSIQLFELGRRRIPPLEVDFITAQGDTLQRRTAPLDIQVVGVRPQGDDELRPIQPPVPIPGGVPLWEVLAAGIALVLVAGVLVHRWMMHRERPAVEAPPPPPVDHAAEFIRIAGMGLLERGEYKQYYALLADNLRRYLEQRMAVEAMELTTHEVVAQLRHTGLPEALIGEVQSFLEAADLVKFAKAVPARETARRFPEEGVALVQRMDRWAAEQRAAERRAEEVSTPR